MNHLSLSGSGLELANVVVNSDLLHLSWNQICALYAQVNASQQLSLPVSVRCRVDEQPNYTVIAFATFPICTKLHLQEAADLVSSTALKQDNFPHFESLCSKGNPSFSIHSSAIILFRNHFNDFLQLKSQLIDPTTNQLLRETPLIFTGHSLGGSIAALFNLWLLGSVSPKSKKPPLCVTFGSPLIGDKGLQRAVSDRSRWNSCFLHVAGNQDPLPGLFISSAQNPQTSPQNSLYKPFGTYLFCSELGCACAHDPDSILMILKGLESTRSRESNEINYYGTNLESLKNMFLLKTNSQHGLSVVNSPQAGIVSLLEASGINMTQAQNLIREFERENFPKIKPMNQSKKLNEIKINMAQLEWYKKVSKTKGIGYYDSYKYASSRSDLYVTTFKKSLTNYWREMVEGAEKKPQKETAFIREMWLFAGTNFRRMVEPLDIAEYYREDGNRDYRSQGRPKFYSLLEKWAAEDSGQRPAGNPVNKRKHVAGNLTEDSCFWADVEEAIVRVEMLNSSLMTVLDKDLILEDLRKFEESVMDQISDSAVSPEIFLEGSSFMKWWKEYLKIRGPWYDSPLNDFMKNCRYEQYKEGIYWESDIQMNY